MLAGLDARVLISVGTGDPAALGLLPSNVRVERWVCQREVIPHCAVVVCHAGSGTFLGALRHGVPLVCLPQAADQVRNAGAVTARGVGVSLYPDDVTPTTIAGVVRDVLADESCAAASAQVAAEISDMPSPAACVGTLLSGVGRAEVVPTAP